MKSKPTKIKLTGQSDVLKLALSQSFTPALKQVLYLGSGKFRDFNTIIYLSQAKARSALKMATNFLKREDRFNTTYLRHKYLIYKNSKAEIL